MSYICNGYRYVKAKGHPRSNSLGYAREHLLIAEKALGRALPPDAVVHHINGIRNDNRNCNLVICENDPYHGHLHYRQRIVERGGDPETQKICAYCKRLLLKTDFNKCFSSYDRLAGRCKQCCSVWRKTHRAHINAYRTAQRRMGKKNI